LSDPDDVEDLRLWLEQPPEDRILEVERLRREWYGDQSRLQRVVEKYKLK
jgi:hypothetical protein